MKNNYLCKKESIDWELCSYFSEIDMPRYVWLTEFIMDNKIDSEDTEKVCGEILIDSTGIDDLDSVILLHLPGCIIVNSKYHYAYPEERSLLVHLVPRDTSYNMYHDPERERG